MLTNLRHHPDSPCDAVTAIDVDLTRSAGGILSLRYTVTGAIRELEIPELANPGRADELWRHTCFEVFIRTGGETYCEFNFAPTGQWAAYRFRTRRSGRTDIAEVQDAGIGTRQFGDRYALGASLDLGAMKDLPDGPWTLAVTTIIEETSGRKSYWSIKHAPGQPDFHQLDGFVLELPVTEQT
jgi:hypothetical protein